MADVRITALAAASSLNDSDVLHGVQAADNKDRKFSLADLKTYVGGGGGGGGTVSSVTAGAGLANSGTATDPIIDVGAGTGITVNTNNIAIDRTVVDTWYASTANASETVKGIVELATAAETTTGTDNTRAVHPAGLKVELDKKAPLAGPTFTGVPKAPTAAAGTNTTQLATTAFVKAAVTAGTPDASETVKGIAEIATTAEVTAGTDDATIVTPLKLKQAQVWGRTGTVLSPSTAGDQVDTGTGKLTVGGVALWIVNCCWNPLSFNGVTIRWSSVPAVTAAVVAISATPLTVSDALGVPAVTAALTKAVVASWVVLVPAVAVGALGTPVNVGPASGAFLSSSTFRPAGCTALVLSVPVVVSAAVASSTMPLTVSEASGVPVVTAAVTNAVVAS